MTDKSTSLGSSMEYDSIREVLLNAGMLVTDIQSSQIPDEVFETDIEAMLPIQLSKTTASWADLLDEDRGRH